MTAALITAAVIIIAGGYIRWAVVPIGIAFSAGRLYERIRTHRR
jgi:hypothetical protein